MNSYKKICTEFYAIDKPNAPTEALEFYLRYAQKAKGLILEPMCGSGRFLLPFLEHGFSIDGMDADTDDLIIFECLRPCTLGGIFFRLVKKSLPKVQRKRLFLRAAIRASMAWLGLLPPPPPPSAS